MPAVTIRGETRGRFIAFEGGEGSGKSTQAARLAAALGALLTREPGGTDLGRHIRELVLGADLREPAGTRAEALLMAADRAQHVASVVRPALRAGRDVVTDRYAGSSLAYQGYGRGLDIADVRWLSDWATEGLWPDLVILLDVPPIETQARLAASRVGPDRLEAAGDDFHQHVARGFHVLAQETPDTWRVVDGSGSVDEVFSRVETTVAEFFARCG